MKIKITIADGRDIILNVQATITTPTPSGRAYWRIDYLLADGGCVYSAHSGAIHGTPSPVEALDWEKEIWVDDPKGTAEKHNHDKTITKGCYRRTTNRAELLKALEAVVL